MKFQGFRLLPLFTSFIILFAFSLTYPTNLFARSGCCSHHSGVCGCGCCDGTPLSDTCAPYYPQCSQPIYLAPATSRPLIVSTPKATISVIATITPTSTPTETSTPVTSPTPSPEVKGALTENSPSPSPARLTTGETLGTLAFLGIVIGLPTWFLVKKFRNPKPQI
jgi:hypothetical protein